MDINGNTTVTQRIQAADNVDDTLSLYDNELLVLRGVHAGYDIYSGQYMQCLEACAHIVFSICLTHEDTDSMRTRAVEVMTGLYRLQDCACVTRIVEDLMKQWCSCNADVRMIQIHSKSAICLSMIKWMCGAYVRHCDNIVKQSLANKYAALTQRLIGLQILMHTCSSDAYDMLNSVLSVCTADASAMITSVFGYISILSNDEDQRMMSISHASRVLVLICNYYPTPFKHNMASLLLALSESCGDHEVKLDVSPVLHPDNYIATVLAVLSQSYSSTSVRGLMNVIFNKMIRYPGYTALYSKIANIDDVIHKLSGHGSILDMESNNTYRELAVTCLGNTADTVLQWIAEELDDEYNQTSLKHHQTLLNSILSALHESCLLDPHGPVRLQCLSELLRLNKNRSHGAASRLVMFILQYVRLHGNGYVLVHHTTSPRQLQTMFRTGLSDVESIRRHAHDCISSFILSCDDDVYHILKFLEAASLYPAYNQYLECRASDIVKINASRGPVPTAVPTPAVPVQEPDAHELLLTRRQMMVEEAAMYASSLVEAI